MVLILFEVYLVLAVLTAISFIYFLINAVISWKYSKSQEKIEVSSSEITILLPVYNEDPLIFEECMKGAELQNCPVIVVGDSCDQPYREIAESHGAHFILKEEREGQKKAIQRGIREVDTKYTLLIDSELYTLVQFNYFHSGTSYMESGIQTKVKSCTKTL